MSSREGRRQPKIPGGSYPREEAVNLRGTVGVPSPSPARIGEPPCGGGTDLMEKVVERSNMLRALRRVESNKGAAGVDGMEIKSLRPYLKEHWPRIREELLKGTYRPQPVRRVEIPKPDGGVRLLGIPTVLDRLIQQALLQVLTPTFDPGFSEHSFGFRPGRNAHQAVKEAQGYIREGYRYVVDLDLEKFFDNSYLSGAILDRKASDVLRERLGVCEHYSRLAAALLRAAGIPARVIHGYARRETEAWHDVLKGEPNHAWNEVFVGGRWLVMDVTWDAGFVESNRFVRSFSRKYFGLDPAVFAETHLKTVEKY